MNKFAIIENIIFLPKRFFKGNTSIYTLLKESGYFEMNEQISEADIFKELTQQLECIEGWLSLSEDKRGSSGWYFKQNDNGKYVVGYFPPKENFGVYEYIDKVEACAAFIKREIEDIKNS